MDQGFSTLEFRESKTPKAILVIGVGNEYMGDDGVGLFIARKLKAQNLPIVQVEVQTGEAASLIEAWEAVEAVILLDAVRSDGSPGRIYQFKAPTEFIPNRFFNSSTHNFGVAEAVELARTLGRLPRCLTIYGIEGRCFEVGRRLSPEVEQAAGDVIQRVIRDIYEEIENVSMT